MNYLHAYIDPTRIDVISVPVRTKLLLKNYKISNTFFRISIIQTTPVITSIQFGENSL